MSTEAQNYVDQMVVDVPGIPRRTQAVLHAVASLMFETPDRADSHRVCFAHQTKIAARAGCSERALRTHIKTLEKMRILVRHRHCRESGGRGRAADSIRIVGFSDQPANSAGWSSRLTGNGGSTNRQTASRPTGNQRRVYIDETYMKPTTPARPMRWASTWTLESRHAIDAVRMKPETAHVATSFFDRVAPTLGPCVDVDPAAYVDDVVDRLQRFDAAVLSAAAARMNAERSSRLPAALDVENAAIAERRRCEPAPGCTRITKCDRRFSAAVALVAGNSPPYAEACRTSGFIDVRHDRLKKLEAL